MAKRKKKRVAVTLGKIARRKQSLLDKVIQPLWDEQFIIDPVPGSGTRLMRPRGAKPGRKDDDGKPRAGLMITDFADALRAVAAVTTFGAKKYAPRDWRKVPDAVDRYTDALHRHLLAHHAGERVDKESKLSHLAMAGWNLLALIELDQQELPI